MKAPLTLLAIAIVCAVLSVINLTSCTKDTTNPNPELKVGGVYKLASNRYNTGAFQPASPLTVKSLYVKYDGGYWADCYARVNWNAFNVSGTANITKAGNDSLMKHYGKQVGDTSTVIWNIPQGDLER